MGGKILIRQHLMKNKPGLHEYFLYIMLYLNWEIVMKSKKAKVIEFTEEYWNKKTEDPSLLNLFSENFIYRTIVGSRVGKESYHTHGENWKHAFPDWVFTITHITEVKNAVMVECNCKGTHLNLYKDTDKKDNIVSKTRFLNEFQMHQPSKITTVQSLEAIYIFGKSSVEHVWICGDEAFYRKQLRMGQHPGGGTASTSLCKNINAQIKTPLTKRELECLSLGFYCYTAKDIARMLGISHRTVETHHHQAYQKLGCSHRQQCLDLMSSLNLLPLFRELADFILKK
ncbi:MAG: LuxR C-terminal-related transcriptional regulator [Waddliaceae bacterium]